MDSAELNANTNPTPPSVLASVKLLHWVGYQKWAFPLPKRNGIAGETTDGGLFVETTNEATALPAYQGKKLSDFYSQGAVLVMPAGCHLAGGTPTARPEDLEVHPETKEVFIAYTDGAEVMDIPILESLWFPSTAVPSTPHSLPRTLQDYRRQLRWHGDLPLAAIC